MDDVLWDTHAMEGMLLNSFQQYELGKVGNIVDSFFESLKTDSTTPLFGNGLRSTQIGTTMLFTI